MTRAVGFFRCRIVVTAFDQDMEDAVRTNTGERIEDVFGDVQDRTRIRMIHADNRRHDAANPR